MAQEGLSRFETSRRAFSFCNATKNRKTTSVQSSRTESGNGDFALFEFSVQGRAAQPDHLGRGGDAAVCTQRRNVDGQDRDATIQGI